MEHQHELQKREVAKEVEQFRKECQHKEESRDYDLIDPTTLKSSSPLNVCLFVFACCLIVLCSAGCIDYKQFAKV